MLREVWAESVDRMIVELMLKHLDRRSMTSNEHSFYQYLLVHKVSKGWKKVIIARGFIQMTRITRNVFGGWWMLSLLC